jgi:hypothetical protein
MPGKPTRTVLTAAFHDPAWRAEWERRALRELDKLRAKYEEMPGGGFFLDGQDPQHRVISNKYVEFERSLIMRMIPLACEGIKAGQPSHDKILQIRELDRRISELLVPYAVRELKKGQRLREMRAKRSIIKKENRPWLEKCIRRELEKLRKSRPGESITRYSKELAKLHNPDFPTSARRIRDYFPKSD